jgi:AbiV family abortive infection protein
LEETAKAEVLLYRRSTNEVPAKKKREPLRDHAAKHLIAVRPTVFMGRLVDLLGVKRCEALKLEAETGGLNQLREVALYFEVRDGRMVTPGSTISFSRAREVLLLALEAADDILVGNTNRSFAYGKRFEDLIIKVLELKESGAINEADKSV